WTRDAPILLVCLGRADLLDARPGWGGGKLNATSLGLEPLPERDCAALIDNLLGDGGLGPARNARIAEIAGGNPLFVEEMVSMLVDDGLVHRGGAWHVERDLSNVAVPATIQALLAARLDRLDPVERRVLELASVEGLIFHRGAVSTLCGGEISVDGPLQELVRRGLVRPEPAIFRGEECLGFRHGLLRDAAYAGIPKEERAELHERYAEWLEQVAGTHAPEYEEFLGYHLEQAHRLRGELAPVDDRGRELARRAAAHLSSAGRRAFARDDVPATVSLLSRAA